VETPAPSQLPLTRDEVCRGLLALWQPRKGYRFNVDSVLLGAFASGVEAPGLVVDAGAGCGLVGLYVARVTGQRVLLVERQEQMVRLAARNAVENALLGVSPVHGDYKALPLAAGSVALLVSNPPFLAPGTGRPSPNAQRTLSHQAVFGGAPELLREAERVLSPQGALVVLLPPAQQDALQSGVLHRRQTWLLTPREGQAPTRSIVVWRRQAGPHTHQTRVVHGEDGRFSQWLEDILEGRVAVAR
jgi:tRNA1Val (adenine37-N6)-methyltransferase